MAPVSHIEGAWTAANTQRRFHYELWKPAGIRGLLVLIHGFGEHGGRYQPFAQALAEQGLCVAVPDLAGHGRSSGARGHVSVDQCVSDLLGMTGDVFLPASSQARYALFGHSFGGLVAIRWALQEPAQVRCLVAQSPLLEVGFPIPLWQQIAASLLATCWPAYSFSMNLDVNGLSHDPLIREAYRTDPLVHNCMSAGTYRDVLRARDQAFAQAASLQVPTLMLCGAEDRIISLAHAQRWYERLGGDKRLVMFPRCYHELHHEPVRDEVVRLTSEWMLARGM